MIEWDSSTHSLLLTNARTSEDMSREELAKKLKVSALSIYNWETGNTSPRPKSVHALLEQFGEDAFDPETAIVDDSKPGSFARWVELNRKKQGWSRRELAHRASITAMTVWNIESGKTQTPQQSTVERLEAVFKATMPKEAGEELQGKKSVGVEGVGAFESFDPHDRENLPRIAGVYVFYDISERPVYVGKAQDIAKRISDRHTGHWDKFWYKSPIVHTAAYVRIADLTLRNQIESVMIRFMKSNAVINRQGVQRNDS